VSNADTAGKEIECMAAVAFEAKKPLQMVKVKVSPPQKGEVRIKTVAVALCHTDAYTLDGHDPEGRFPTILGHEAAGIVESCGEGVTEYAPGDHVIPCYQAYCGDCKFCERPNINLCTSVRAATGGGVMLSDSKPRYHTMDGQPIFHFMGTSSFVEYSVLHAQSLAKIRRDAPLEKCCLLGCGIATGWGAVWNTAQVERGATAAVFGLGAVGLAVVQAAKAVGCTEIVGVDINESKFPLATKLGATKCLNSKDLDKPTQQVLVGMSPTGFGYDYTFDCTGNTNVMRSALEASHRGWGTCVLIGVAAAGAEISTRPFQFITGRRCTGTAFGGWKTRDAIPMLVEKCHKGEIEIDHYVTHVFEGVAGQLKAIEALHSGDCLRAIVKY
jgi:S-(hydroxymethyl)glutathione dehydrogenase/alcohol dehydrogenase